MNITVKSQPVCMQASCKYHLCPRINHLLYYQGREGNGNPLQYSWLENPMDGGAWQAAVHGVAKSRTQLSDFTFTFHFHALEKDMAKIVLRGKFTAIQSYLSKQQKSQINNLTFHLLLLLLSRFSCVRLCATPQTAAHQAPPSLGFSRQEHWSGLPFPSPMHKSEK